MSFTAAGDALYAGYHMALTVRKKEERKAMIGGLSADPQVAEPIWPGKTSEISSPIWVNS